jgi:HSP20 family molecular chaperone IbpA
VISFHAENAFFVPHHSPLIAHHFDYLTTSPLWPFIIFAGAKPFLIESREMSTSPFHGIFSALSHSSKENPVEEEQAFPLSAAESGATPSVGRVAVDIFEQDDYYIIKAPIAGVRMADIDIEITDNVVTIRGNRRQTDTAASDQYYLQESFWGPFSRSVTLPCAIDPRKVKATFNKECILKILVPKEEKVKIVKINEV